MFVMHVWLFLLKMRNINIKHYYYYYAIRAVLPWCFAYNRINYSCHLSDYYAEMTRLYTDHPVIHVQLQNGWFSVKLGRQNPYGRILVDQTIEETINSDTKTPEESKGFSLKPAALSRYYLTVEYRSTCLKQPRELTYIKPPGVSHHDLKSFRITKDEQAVQSLVDLMETEWINPFSGEPTELIGPSTGTVAPSDWSSNCQGCGETAYKKFQDERIGLRKKPIHHPLPKQKLKTFSEINKLRVAKCTNKETTSCLAIWYSLQQAGSWTWNQCWPIYLDHCHGRLVIVMAR